MQVIHSSSNLKVNTVILKNKGRHKDSSAEDSKICLIPEVQGCRTTTVDMQNTHNLITSLFKILQGLFKGKASSLDLAHRE